MLAVSGAAELYPRIGAADAIVDIVSSGRTAEENGLEVVDEIMTQLKRKGLIVDLRS